MTLSIAGSVVQGFSYTTGGSVNLLSPGSGAPSGYSITDLTYNQDARPSSLNSNGQPAIGFAYDGFGQRVSVANIPNSCKIIYQYGQGGLLQEQANANGTTQADYIYLHGRPIAVLNPGTATVSFLHDDRLGTPQMAH